MLDPYYIINMEQKSRNSPTYVATLKAPNKLGVFKFAVEYWRYGYSFIDEVTEVTVKQFRHDEYPRFLPVAYPYYLNVFAQMGAGFLFVMTYLYADFSNVKGVKRE